MKIFDKKIVLITGGSSGIGRSCAIKFANEGANVIIASRNTCKAEMIVNEIRDRGGFCNFFPSDVSEPEQIIKLFKHIELNFGHLDYAVNNAAISGPAKKYLHEYPDDDWHKIIDTNLTGVWLCMKYEIPLLLNGNNGALVNVSSVAGLQAGKVSAAYTASKHGVIGLTKAAAIEYASHGIRVNAICPAYINTPMLTEDLSGLDTAAQSIIPMQRCGTPEEVANAILWLCSKNSSFVNGVALPIDGGLIA